MDTSAGQGLYPLHRCKTLHFVRHAQGFHNVAGEKDHSAYSSYDYLDASLTPLGWEQVDNLRKHVQSSGLSKKVELVVVSPLMRTLQTAAGVFGGGEHSDGKDVPPLMVADARNSGRPAVSSFDCPPFLAVELCREILGDHPCDKRSTRSEYQSSFPAVDFSLIESDEDILWSETVRESNKALAERGMKFMKWLWTRQEKEIAIVTHSGFLFQTLGAFGDDCHPVVQTEIRTHFKNCELRSMTFVDKSMASGDSSSTTNFTGNLSNGPGLPVDTVTEKLSQNNH